MAGYSDLIERGIRENNMKLVAKGYNLMFGKNIEVAKSENEEDDNGVTTTGVTLAKKGRLGRIEEVKVAKVNLFVDEEGERRAKAKGVTAKPIKKNRVKRDTTSLQGVKCTECRKTYKIRKDLIIRDSDYVCNDCITSRGGR